MVRIEAYGDSGLRIQFGEDISKTTNEKIRCFCLLLREKNIPGLIEWIPTYTAVSLIYDPYILFYEDLEKNMEHILSEMKEVELPPAKIFEIPVLYGGNHGPDLPAVAEKNKLDEQRIIELHTSGDYLIYMMGFIPGFTYLGGMPEAIAMPRKATPRSEIPAGSVGIAGKQTGIYPVKSPGGWQIIGKTPVKLYDETKDSPILLEAGNYIRFVPVTEKEFLEIEKKVEAGIYVPRTRLLQEGVEEHEVSSGFEQ
ncbi:5-oxoprolinase subunit PxpB [Virgibacillus kimchii]